MPKILILTLIVGVVLVALWFWEPRSMLNAGVFGVFLGLVYLLFMEIAFQADWGAPVFAFLTLGIFLGAPLLYIVGSLLLIWNGRTMIRKEGLSLSHLLAPLVGGVPFLAGFALIGLVAIGHIGDEWLASAGLTILGIATAAFGYLLANAWFTIPYGALYTFWPKSHDPDVIVVHGAGLIDGRVTALLRSRCDKAIAMYTQGESRAQIIVSGGQGADEPRSEAAAMAEYLTAQGIDSAHISLEDQSTTTWENMVNSRGIIEQTGFAGGKIVFVTSNYHVFRTALIARRAGLNAQGIGSHTARNYLPSAIIREYVAILSMYKWWHILPIGGLIIINLLLMWLV